MSEEGKDSHHHLHHLLHHHHEHHEQEEKSPLPPPPPQYGTFQGVSNYPQPVIGFPQPVPPPGATQSPGPPSHQHYSHGYQAVPGYPVTEGRPVRERRLPCCGLGLGWCLFIIGFFLAAIPWYVGAILLLCGRVDYREKPGYITCTIALIGSFHECVRFWAERGSSLLHGKLKHKCL